MTAIYEAILALALSLTPWHGDHESPAERESRMEVFGEAITYAVERSTCTGAFEQEGCTRIWNGDPLELGVVLLGLAQSESGLAKHIHEDRCRDDECDPFVDKRTGRIGHRAKSSWQIQWGGKVPAAEWRTIGGSSPAATARAAWAAAKVLSFARERCGSLQGAVSLYGTGTVCNWPRSRARTESYLRMLAKARSPVVESP
jgi:hypothetical protein